MPKKPKNCGTCKNCRDRIIGKQACELVKEWQVKYNKKQKRRRPAQERAARIKAEKEAAAAVKIQAAQRGKAARRKVTQMQQDAAAKAAAEAVAAVLEDAVAKAAAEVVAAVLEEVVTKAASEAAILQQRLLRASSAGSRAKAILERVEPAPRPVPVFDPTRRILTRPDPRKWDGVRRPDPPTEHEHDKHTPVRNFYK